MTTARIVVTVLGALVIVWVNYWFLWAGRARAKAVSDQSSAPSRSLS